MDTNARFARIATATPEILERIDAILEGKEPSRDPQKPNNRLLTVAGACFRAGGADNFLAQSPRRACGGL